MSFRKRRRSLSDLSPRRWKPRRRPDRPGRTPALFANGDARWRAEAPWFGQSSRGKLGRFTEVKERVQFWYSELGDYSYIERHAQVIYTKIGKFCAVAANACINALEHPIERVSQHKITYRPNEYFLDATLDKNFRERRRAQIVDIGNDVWVGQGAILMPDVQIGHGAVIAAGAVVTKDVVPYAVVAGVPAHFLKWRFEAKISERMMTLAWWDWEHDRLAGAIADMQMLGVEAFLEKYES